MEKRKRKWGDRFDGYWVRDMDAMHVIMPHVYNRRSDSEVFVLQEFDVTKLLKHIEKLNRKHSDYRTTIFHAVLFGLGKIIYHRPLLNRFISGRRTYQRYNIELAFIAKKEFSDRSEETMLRETVKEEWTLDSLSRYIASQVKEAKIDNKNSTEDSMAFLAKLPRPILALVAGVVKTLDKFGKVPKFLWEGDINYSTVLLTNLGSIQAPAVYHHLNEYGTASIIVAIGTLRKKPTYTSEGKLKEYRDVLDLGITIDERISDGFYFARSLKLLDKMLDDPALFDLPIEESINV